MTLVVDASVIVKWLISDPEREAETAQATRVMQAITKAGDAIIQPPHWLYEVGAVLARLSPATAEEDLSMLQALELPVDDSPAVIASACRLAIESGQHLFDTLYHAVAMERPDAMLVTADDRYLRACHRHGQIVGLSQWTATD